ncbi:hypothetical protein BB560_006412, partial [Smittium megazygosporum]
MDNSSSSSSFSYHGSLDKDELLEEEQAFPFFKIPETRLVYLNNLVVQISLEYRSDVDEENHLIYEQNVKLQKDLQLAVVELISSNIPKGMARGCGFALFQSRKKWQLFNKYVFTKDSKPILGSQYKYRFDVELIDDSQNPDWSDGGYIEITETEGDSFRDSGSCFNEFGSVYSPSFQISEESFNPLENYFKSHVSEKNNFPNDTSFVNTQHSNTNSFQTIPYYTEGTQMHSQSIKHPSTGYREDANNAFEGNDKIKGNLPNKISGPILNNEYSLQNDQTLFNPPVQDNHNDPTHKSTPFILITKRIDKSIQFYTPTNFMPSNEGAMRNKPKTLTQNSAEPYYRSKSHLSNVDKVNRYSKLDPRLGFRNSDNFFNSLKMYNLNNRHSINEKDNMGIETQSQSVGMSNRNLPSQSIFRDEIQSDTIYLPSVLNKGSPATIFNNLLKRRERKVASNSPNFNISGVNSERRRDSSIFNQQPDSSNQLGDENQHNYSGKPSSLFDEILRSKKKVRYNKDTNTNTENQYIIGTPLFYNRFPQKSIGENTMYNRDSSTGTFTNSSRDSNSAEKEARNPKSGLYSRLDTSKVPKLREKSNIKTRMSLPNSNSYAGHPYLSNSAKNEHRSLNISRSASKNALGSLIPNTPQKPMHSDLNLSGEKKSTQTSQARDRPSTAQTPLFGRSAIWKTIEFFENLATNIISPRKRKR